MRGDEGVQNSSIGSAEPGGVAVRPARREDYDAIVALWRAAGLPFRPLGRDAREAYEGQLGCFQGLYLVAEAASGLVGVVFGTHDGRKGWINRLAVHPAWRRKGVATALMGACERGFSGRGIGLLAALVEAENKESKAFFEGLGYRTDVPVCYYRKVGNPEV